MEHNTFMEDKVIKPKSGVLFLFLNILIVFILIAGIPLSILSKTSIGKSAALALFFADLILFIPVGICFAGFKLVKPNMARVFTLFGKHYGVVTEAGFYYMNPFVEAVKERQKISEEQLTFKQQNSSSIPLQESQKYTETPHISMKTRTLLNNKQKINDELGNPIEISIAVIWRIGCVTKAVFNVDDYKEYLSIQCDGVLRNVVRSYPYDVSNNEDEKTLRGSSIEISQKLKEEIQEKVENAGIEIIDARITHLAYAPEIATAMLQRQQATAIVDARQMIVEGAVSMVDMALEKLSKENIVELDEERKAQMVSNLLVVLCGNKDAQPIVNSGSLY